jgi:hypothetical protein
MTEISHDEIKRKLRPGRIVIPVLLGLSVVAWILLREIKTDVLTHIAFTWESVFWLGVAFMFLISETFFYMWRIRVLSDNELTWRQSFRIIILWEFTSAISPSTVGGTAVAVVFLNREGITVGRSTAIVLLTSFLDELYFVVLFPLMLLIIGPDKLLINTGNNAETFILNNLVVVALLGFSIILIWVFLVGYGLFLNPQGIKKLMIAIFKLPILRRWYGAAEKAGIDIVESSRELKRKPPGFWIKAALSTFFTWTSRYLIINGILMAFFIFREHLLLFARQLVLWIMMIISPTPGGSGFAEVILGNYISDLIPANPDVVRSLGLTMAVLWRLVGYYPVLIAGAIIVPGWISRKFIPKIIKKK